MFAPRGSRSKRSNSLPQVRVDDEELDAIRWLQKRMSARHGKALSISDVMRLAAECLYEIERAQPDPAAVPTAAPAPEQ